MKRLLENWRKLLEGDVIQGPWGKEDLYDRTFRKTGTRIPHLKGAYHKSREDFEREGNEYGEAEPPPEEYVWTSDEYDEAMARNPRFRESRMEKEEAPRNAMIANEIDSTIQDHMTKKYGGPESWTLEQLNTMEQISDLLDVIFPSGE